MSTLTKVLIVLQVVFSILLCGVVISYVATANDYKEMYESQRRAAQAAKNEKDRAADDLRLAIEKHQEELGKAQATIETLTGKNTELAGQVQALNLEKTQLMQDVAKWASAANAASASAEKQTQLFEETNGRLEALRVEYSDLERKYKETNDTLMEKLAIIDQQNDQIRILTEQKTELTAQLDRYLLPAGQAVATSAPTVQPRYLPVPAPEARRKIDLKGQITAVDLNERLALISIGANQGVRERMTFHVTRGNQFVCDIQILDVDANQAVGTIQVGQMNPMTGDQVTTNL